MSLKASAPDRPVDTISVRLATLFGVGYVPKAPGTAASLVTLPAAYGLAVAGFWPYLFVAIFLTAAAIPICGRAATVLGHPDPPCIVLDECAGMLISFCPFSLIVFPHRLSCLLLLFAAFCFFRWFDIRKPLFVKKAQDLRGGFGIVLDDVAAAVLAAMFTGILWWVASHATPRPVH